MSVDKVIVSTGPRTNEGLQISSRNALRHGCCSTETLILKSENIEDYHTLEATWLRGYLPKDEAERHLLQELVNADWFLQRATRNVSEVEAKISEAVPNLLEWEEQHHRTLARFLRYQTTRQNALNRCRKALEDYRKHRASEKASEEKLVIARERHAIHKVKNQPEPTWDETLANMRGEAVRLGYRSPDKK